MMGVNPGDLDVKNGFVFVKNSNEKKVSVADIATTAQLPPLMTVKGDLTRTAGIKGTIIGASSAVPPSNPTPTAAVFAEVEVDVDTGNVKVARAVSVHDVGKAINPMAAEGKVEGGFTQGLGYALMEKMIFDEGSGTCLTSDFLDYKIPTALEAAKVETLFLENAEPTGPFGAKGIGEPPIIAVAPAIANAVYNAVGVRIRELPITPEKVLRALGKL